MKSNTKWLIWTIVIVLILTGLFTWSRLGDPYQAEISKWKSGGIKCLNNHSQTAKHIHPHLQIVIDGRQENIPANVGINPRCMSEIHTHDASGTLHVEPVTIKDMFLKDFFHVWDKPLERAGYKLEMTVNGQPSEDFGNLLLEDGQEIVLSYTSN